MKSHFPIILIAALLLLLSGCNRESGTERSYPDRESLPADVVMPTYPQETSAPAPATDIPATSDPWQAKPSLEGTPVPIPEQDPILTCNAPDIEDGTLVRDGNRVYFQTKEEADVTIGISDGVSFLNKKDTQTVILEHLMEDMAQLRKDTCQNFDYSIRQEKQELISGRVYTWIQANLTYEQYGDPKEAKMIVCLTELSSGAHAYFAVAARDAKQYTYTKEVARTLAATLEEAAP